MATSAIAFSSYTSPVGRPGMVARLSPSLVFYPALVRIILQAAHQAKRGQYRSQEWIQSSLQTVNQLERVGVRFIIEATEQLSKLDAPCVFIANHMSTLETFALPCMLRPHGPVTFVVKRSLVTYPVFKHVMRSRDPVVVDRENPRADLKAVLEGGEQRLRKGVSVVVFPQSTRSVRIDAQHFNSIGIKLARRAGVPVVPVALKTDAWGAGRLIKDFGPIDPRKPARFTFGEPLRIQGNGKQEHNAVFDFIHQRIEQWIHTDDPR
ncbi:MAG: lysophospholipid acyltransferase family protein [Thermodesulfobacteriota bacterium]